MWRVYPCWEGQWVRTQQVWYLRRILHSLCQGNLFFVKSVVNKVLSVLLTYLPSRKIRSEANYLLPWHFFLNFVSILLGFHKEKEEEANKKKSPPQTCRQHLVKHILAEPSFSRGDLTRADKKYIINRCLGERTMKLLMLWSKENCIYSAAERHRVCKVLVLN